MSVDRIFGMFIPSKREERKEMERENSLDGYAQTLIRNGQIRYPMPKQIQCKLSEKYNLVEAHRADGKYIKKHIHPIVTNSGNRAFEIRVDDTYVHNDRFTLFVRPGSPVLDEQSPRFSEITSNPRVQSGDITAWGYVSKCRHDLYSYQDWKPSSVAVRIGMKNGGPFKFMFAKYTFDGDRPSYCKYLPLYEAVRSEDHGCYVIGTLGGDGESAEVENDLIERWLHQSSLRTFEIKKKNN